MVDALALGADEGRY